MLINVIWIWVNNGCRSALKFPWLCICCCTHFKVCDKNLDLTRPSVAKMKLQCGWSKSNLEAATKIRVFSGCLLEVGQGSPVLEFSYSVFYFSGQWPLSVEIHFPELKKNHKWKISLGISSEVDECSPSLHYTRKGRFVMKILLKGAKA